MKKEDLQPHDWFFKIVSSNPKVELLHKLGMTYIEDRYEKV
jgi:hypothetical protein